MSRENTPSAPPSLEEMLRLPVVYSVPGMDAVKALDDIVYGKADKPGGTIELKLDLYRPGGPPPASGFPVIVFLSGGGVENPDWRKAAVYRGYGRLAAALGFAGVTYQKRYAQGPESLQAGRDDTAALFSYLREHAAEYGFDPDRLAVWVFSAGGLLLGPLLADRPPFLRAVLSFYALTDALPAMPEATVRAIRGGGFGAVEEVRKGGPLPALFVGRAGLDNPDLNAAADDFAREALRRNADIEILNHPEGRHGFDVLDDDARTREIIARAFAFLKTRLAAEKS